MRLILRKIFNDRNYVLFLLISSSAMIFVVPIGSHVYRYLGPAMLLFFLAAKYFQGEMTASRLRNFKPDRSIFLFAVLLGLSCVSFVPQTFGTMLIFATLYLGIRGKVIVSRGLLWLLLTIIMLILAFWIYHYVNQIPVYGKRVNNNLLGVKIILFFICSVKFVFWPGQIMAVAGAFLTRCRTLLLSLLVYGLTLVPVIRKRLSGRSVIIYFFLITSSIVIMGVFFSDVKINFQINSNAQQYLKLFDGTTLNGFSAGRLEINNVFFRNLSGDYHRILFGKGLDYKGAPSGKRKKVNLVHNSFLDVFARQGLFFIMLYLYLLAKFFIRYAKRKDFQVVITMITYGALFNGIFNTFPLILQLCLLLIIPSMKNEHVDSLQG